MTADLNELERLLRDATAGPWECDASNALDDDWIIYGDNGCAYAVGTVSNGNGYAQNTANAALIAALRNSAEELIRDARRYREAEELGRYQDCGDKHRDWLSVGAWLYPGDRIVVVRAAIAQEQK